MHEKAKSGRDAFTFSLRGLTTVSSFTIAPAVAHNHLSKVWDEKLSREQEDQPDTAREMQSGWGRFWLRKRRRAA